MADDSTIELDSDDSTLDWDYINGDNNTTDFEISHDDYKKIIANIRITNVVTNKNFFVDIIIKNENYGIEVMKCSNKIRLTILLNDAKRIHKCLRKKDIEIIPDYDICNLLLEIDDTKSLKYFMKYFMEHKYYYYYDLPLKRACKLKNYEAIRILMYYSEYRQICDILVKKCADLNEKITKILLKKLVCAKYLENKDYEKILCSSIKNDEIERMKLIFEYCEDIELKDYYNELLETALENELEKISEYLLGCNICIHAELEYYVIKYANTDNYNMVEILFKVDDYDPKWLNDTFIKLEKCSVDIVQLFIDKGANIEKYGKILCDKAKKCKNRELVKYLDGYDE